MENVVETKTESLPRIGDKAPAFKAVTTQGEIELPRQFEGSWSSYSAIPRISRRSAPPSS